METVTTERLVIRRAAETDLYSFLAYRNHPKNLKWQLIEPMTEEAAASFLASMATVEIAEAGGWFMFAVELRSEVRMIGEVGIYLSPQPQSKGDLGWSFHPDYQGRGYATEAAQVLLAYAFQERELHRVTSGCDTRNVASFRLMERLGMRREGHFLRSQFAKGEWRDEYIYALLRDEWLAGKPGGGKPGGQSGNVTVTWFRKNMQHLYLARHGTNSLRISSVGRPAAGLMPGRLSTRQKPGRILQLSHLVQTDGR